MGWSHAGNTRQKYQHYYSDDGINAMLEADGLQIASSKGAIKGLLKPKMCPNCSESNKPDSRFCTKCKFVLSFDVFNQVTSEAEQSKREIAELKMKQQEESKEKMKEFEILNAKMEIFQANAASLFNALMARDDFGVKTPATIITWRADEGPESLLKAAELARTENEKRERQHKEYHKTSGQVI